MAVKFPQNSVSSSFFQSECGLGWGRNTEKIPRNFCSVHSTEYDFHSVTSSFVSATSYPLNLLTVFCMYTVQGCNLKKMCSSIPTFSAGRLHKQQSHPTLAGISFTLRWLKSTDDLPPTTQ